MATLIITLPLVTPGPGTELDYVLTIDGLSMTRHGRATANLLPPLPGASNEIVVVVPARALSWHRVELPKTLLIKRSLSGSSQSTQLRAALEGLLEDQLLDEPTSLHFALAPEPTADQAPWVAICDHDWLRTSLQILEQAQRPVSRIVPEFAPTADDASQTLHVAVGLEPAQLVLPGTQGVTVLPLGSHAASLLAWPESAAILAEPGVATQAEQLFKRPVTLQSAQQRWLQAARSDWNLAQFDLATSSRTRAVKNFARSWNSLRHAPQWRASRWLVGMLLASQLIGLNALAWKERTVLEQKQAAIRNTLLQTFPDVKVVLDAPLQMEREVSALQQTTGAVNQRDLEAMLTVLSTFTPTSHALTEIDFTPGEARLKGLQLQAGEATQLGAQLRTKGYAMRTEGDAMVIRMETRP
jgi:general secretion pathway protein L